MAIKTFQQSFAGGEISHDMYARLADPKRQSGLALCRNFIPTPQGMVENRAGFEFVAEVKNSALRVHLIPFTYSTTQTMVIEMGAGYFRFHTNGATLMNGAVPYEITNTYLEVELDAVKYVQSGDVVTMTHPNHPPMELRRYAALDWRFVAVNFYPPILAPATVTATSSGAGVTYDYSYVVTAIAADGISESEPSGVATCKNNIFTTGASNTITWTASVGAIRYNIYKYQAGAYGYIGSTTGASYLDDNIASDMAQVPPIYDYSFVPNGIASIAVTAGGTGYNTAPSGRAITSIAVQAGGTLYTNATVSITDATGSGAVATAVITGGVITAINVTNGGAGYSATPTITITGNGTGAVVGAVTLTVTSFQTVALTVTDATGTGAVLSAEVAGGAISAIRVVSPGINYTAPTVTISNAAGGTGAVLGAVTLSGINYPSTASYYEQRRVFAGTITKPQQIWMTKSGTESTMAYSLPVRADDRISFRVAAREANTIRHIVPLQQLVLLTSSAEWRVTSMNSDALTPTTINVKPQSYVGASDVPPLVINNSVIYVAARGGHVREMAYQWQANGYLTGDLSLRATHLFDNYDIVDATYAKAPHPLVWFVSTSGKLIGLTYIPEQKVGAWHQHDTINGTFESCTTVAEGLDDRLYVVVNRTIGGVQKRYIERMAPRLFTNQSDAFFVDSGMTYRGVPATTISGLTHLIGETVNILADGAVVAPQVVSATGSITLPSPASVVTVGLPIISDIQTLPAAAQIDGAMAQGRMKQINRAWLRVYRSGSVFVGQDAASLTEMKVRSNEPYGTAPSFKSDELEIVLNAQWGKTGQVFIRQSNPLPVSLVGLTLEAVFGG